MSGSVFSALFNKWEEQGPEESTVLSVSMYRIS